MTTNEWLDEPNLEVWLDRETQLFCCVLRQSHSGHLCGYVGVPAEHRYYREEYGKLPGEVHESCHGGLSFYGSTLNFLHEPRLWWFGFDCAHHGDLSPLHPRHFEGVYRNFAYVRKNVLSLAKALRNV
jgi:hypothetical protein